MKVINNKAFDKTLTDHVSPLYSFLDSGHNVKHLEDSYNAIKTLTNKAYAHKMIELDEAVLIRVATAYHDVGRIIDEKNHAKHSVTIFRNDTLLNDIIVLEDKEKDIVTDLIMAHSSKKKHSKDVPKQLIWDATHIYLENRYKTIERIIGYHCDRTLNPDSKDEELRTKIRTDFANSYIDKWRSEITRKAYNKPSNFDILGEYEITSKIKTYVKNKKERN